MTTSFLPQDRDPKTQAVHLLPLSIFPLPVLPNSQEKALQKENDVLTKNISSLFNTAKQEIARKDKWIDQLRREIHQLQGKLRENGIS